MSSCLLLLEPMTWPLYRQVMFEGGKLDTKQAKVAVSPWATSADWTPGIWGETRIKLKKNRFLFMNL